MLELVNLHKTFMPGTANEVRALQGVSLTIQPGTFAVLIGSNGSGKSTLLNAVAGSFAPDAGTIRLNGCDLTRLPEHRRAARIGRVFQNPFAGTAAEMSIAENLALAMHRGKHRSLRPALTRNARTQMADRIRELKMDLENRLDNPIGTLSGGQRQALTLLMATWTRPDLLLLDEHTAALDPKSAAKVTALTQSIVQREKLTTLMVTHSMQQAVDMSDRIIMMHRGAIVQDYRDEHKQRIRIPDLMAAFDRLARRELFDESVADLLKSQYA
ncbi:MAG: ATP-binding cassette domain-containing protein [Kiritimatiellae bacterium]|nr:ATP-binding cassette domain-containing protein [Kiritimatiellia bacterium]MDD4737121.1 ATP-binding cassette domain-containing protein [Kiritimatiellia bacterium]